MQLNSLSKQLDHVSSNPLPFYMQVGAAMLGVSRWGVGLSALDYGVFQSLRNEYARGVDYERIRWYNREKGRVVWYTRRIERAPIDEDQLLDHEVKTLNIRTLDDKQTEWRQAVLYVRERLNGDGNLQLRDGRLLTSPHKIADELCCNEAYVTHNHVREARVNDE